MSTSKSTSPGRRSRLFQLGVGAFGVATGLWTLVWLFGGSQPRDVELLDAGSGPPPAAPGPGELLRVMSWNVHYGAGPTLHMGSVTPEDEVRGYLDQIADAITASGADVVALQEVDRRSTRAHGIDQLAYLQDRTGLRYAMWTTTWRAGWVPFPGLDPRRHIGRVWSGQAILSRYPLSAPHREPLPQPVANGWLYNRFYLHRALSSAWLELAHGHRVLVINAHLEAFDVENRAAQVDRVAAVVAQGGPHVLVMGDMNAAPTEALRRHAFPDEPDTDWRDDDTLDRLNAIPGLAEVAPASTYSADEASWFTFPAAAPNRRLDYVFHGTGLELASARVMRFEGAPPSDHLPVVAELRLRAGEAIPGPSPESEVRAHR